MGGAGYAIKRKYRDEVLSCFLCVSGLWLSQRPFGSKESLACLIKDRRLAGLTLCFSACQLNLEEWLDFLFNKDAHTPIDDFTSGDRASDDCKRLGAVI